MLFRSKPPRLALLPGSLLLEDIQGELYLRQASQSHIPDVVASRVRGRIGELLRRFEANFDMVILDCPPGLSFAALAALRIADRVLVPFRPDYVSQLAVDRIALLIEEKANLDALGELPFDDRRYACIANGVRPVGKDRVLIDEIAALHPMIDCTIPHKDAIANAFDWEPRLRAIEDKYGAGSEDIRRLFDQIGQWIAAAGQRPPLAAAE